MKNTWQQHTYLCQSVSYIFNWGTAPSEVVTAHASHVSIYLDLKGASLEGRENVFYKLIWVEEAEKFQQDQGFIVKLILAWPQCYWWSIWYNTFYRFLVSPLPLQFTLSLALKHRCILRYIDTSSDSKRTKDNIISKKSNKRICSFFFTVISHLFSFFVCLFVFFLFFFFPY